MPIPLAVKNLCDEMPAFAVGPLAGRVWWMPKPGVTRGQLAAAGAGSGTLREARIVGTTANGRIVTRRVGVRIFTGPDVLMAPAGWIGSGTSATARPLPDGVHVLGGRNAAAAGSEFEPEDAPHECAVSSGSNATAIDPADGVRKALPLGVVAGPGYQWTLPQGTGLIPHPGIELDAGKEWPDGAPRG